MVYSKHADRGSHIWETELLTVNYFFGFGFNKITLIEVLIWGKIVDARRIIDAFAEFWFKLSRKTKIAIFRTD